MLSTLNAGGKITVAVFATILTFQAAVARAFDFDNGNAIVEVIAPIAEPIVLETVGGSAGSLVLRYTTMASNAWFDAIAPYHPTAIGVYSQLGRRPASEGITNRNKNIAIMYANYRVFDRLLPQRHWTWRAMMTSVGLNPDDTQENTTTAVGIGNLAGNGVLNARERDGMNQWGDVKCQYNCLPYADYTGYKPVNTAYNLRNPSRWQPDIISSGNGIFQVQQAATPQWRLTRPYSYQNRNRFNVSAPNGVENAVGYRQQVDEVVTASANLTDYQKMTAELFDDKPRSLGFAEVYVIMSRGLNLDQTVQFIFASNVAEFDAGIATWNQKYLYDSVRPFSAIRYLYGEQLLTAWGGPGRGTVSNIPAAQWRGYIGTPASPEYPSGTACFCSAHAQASRLFFGSDSFGGSMPIAKGSSSIEPGITPATDIVLGPWNTYTEFENACGMSRVWGGANFTPAIREGQRMCRSVANVAYAFVKAHIDGNESH